MWLRVQGPSSSPSPLAAASAGDSWTEKLAKLMPGEALGLYGAGSSMIPGSHDEVLWALAGGCLAFCAALRFVATRGADGRPQWAAILIASVSFVLWLVALGPPGSPIDLGGYGYVGGLAALVWATVLPAFYKG
jgi:hypothetical protein